MKNKILTLLIALFLFSTTSAFAALNPEVIFWSQYHAVYKYTLPMDGDFPMGSVIITLDLLQRDPQNDRRIPPLETTLTEVVVDPGWIANIKSSGGINKGIVIEFTKDNPECRSKFVYKAGRNGGAFVDMGTVECK